MSNRTMVLYRSMKFEHRPINHKHYEYRGDKQERALVHKFAEGEGEGFINILDKDGYPISSYRICDL